MGEVRLAARKPLVAWSLMGLTLVMLAAALVLLGLNVSRPDASRLDAALIGFYGLLAVGALAYAGAGGLLARRVPGNAIGWLLSLAGLSLTVAMLTEQYALYGLATAPGAVPAAKAAGFRVTILHVLSPDELQPAAEGDLQLIDSETGEQLEIRLDRESRAAYRRHLDAWRDEIAAWCRAQGVSYILVPSDWDVERALLKLLHQGRVTA